MTRKTTAQPATPQRPYVKIEREDLHTFYWRVIDPTDGWSLICKPHGSTRSLVAAQRRGERALRRYLRRKGYQQESWTLTVEES